MTDNAPTATELKTTADAFHAAKADAELVTTWQQLRDAAAQGLYSADVTLSATAAARLLARAPELGYQTQDLGTVNSLRKFKVSWK